MLLMSVSVDQHVIDVDQDVLYKIREVSRINPNLLLKLIFTKTFKY